MGGGPAPRSGILDEKRQHATSRECRQQEKSPSTVAHRRAQRFHLAGKTPSWRQPAIAARREALLRRAPVAPGLSAVHARHWENCRVKEGAPRHGAQSRLRHGKEPRDLARAAHLLKYVARTASPCRVSVFTSRHEDVHRLLHVCCGKFSHRCTCLRGRTAFGLSLAGTTPPL